MADVDFFAAANMYAAQTWYGYVYYAGPDAIIITNGYRDGYYFGSFQYDLNGNVYGALTSYYELAGGQMTMAISGLWVDANLAYNYIQSNQLLPFFSIALAGADVIGGSNSADVLLGFSGNDQIDGFLGNDAIYGGTGSDVIRGSGGNDYIDGGSHNDMAVFSGIRSQYSVTFSPSTGNYIVSGPDGSDTLRSIEKIRFSNGDYFIEDAAGLTAVVHRFYNVETGIHFYTASNAEANAVRSNLPQFDHEGLAFRAADAGAAGSTDIFRFYNAQVGYHFYTASAAERDYIIANLHQYNYEGPGFRAYTADKGPQEGLYRFYNASTGSHFFTTSEVERDSVMANLPQYKYEGVAFYVDVF